MFSDPHSHGLWAITAPPAPHTQALQSEITADVVVIGAGYTGLSAALHLAERGLRVVVLEGAEIGFGGAGRNVGLVNAGMWVMPEALCAGLGDHFGNRLIDLLGDGPRQVFDLITRHGIACEAEPQGTMHLAVGAKGLAEITERARQWQKRGAPVEVLSAEATAARLGTKAYAGALLDRRAGTIQPLAYARGLARAAIGAGATIHTRSPATGLARERAAWRVSTAQGTVRAKWVVMGTDAYSAGPLFPALRTQQVFLPYFNFATAPLPADLLARLTPDREGCWDTREVLTSFRRDAAGRLVFGSVGALRHGGAAVHRAWALRAMARLWPELKGVQIEAAWYGQIGMTSDNLPRFHRFGENIITTCGYNGRGIAPGTVFGKLLAGVVAGEVADADLPLPITTAEPAKLRSLRAGWYEAGAQLVHLTGARSLSG